MIISHTGITVQQRLERGGVRKMKVDKRFNERIWRAQREIVVAFSELSEDVTAGGLIVSMDEIAMQELYKEKTNQAKILLNNTFDLLEKFNGITQKKSRDA